MYVFAIIVFLSSGIMMPMSEEFFSEIEVATRRHLDAAASSCDGVSMPQNYALAGSFIFEGLFDHTSVKSGTLQPGFFKKKPGSIFGKVCKIL